MAAPTFVFSLAFVAASVVPILATVDGIIYVANAKSILTDDFASIYTFYREPIYPLFLKVVHFVGDAGVLVVFSQALFLASAGLVAFLSIYRLLHFGKPQRWQYLLLWLMLTNPMFLLYSGTILQQALFSLQLAIFALLLSLALKPHKSVKPWIIALSVLVWYLLAIFTSIGWIYLGLFPVSVTLLALVWRFFYVRLKQDDKSVPKLAILLLAAVSIPLTLVGTYFVGTQTYNVWEEYKAPFIAESQDDGYVIKPLEEVPYIPTPAEMTNRTLALMNMVVIEPYEKENDLFMSIQMRRQSPSSVWDSAFEGEPQASYALNYFVITNPGEILHNGYARLASFAGIWYHTAFVVMWATSILLLLRKKWLASAILILAPINFLLVYAASNSPIDRYGVPTYAFAAGSTIIFLTIIFRKKKSNKLSN